MIQQYDENAEFVRAPGDNPEFLVAVRPPEGRRPTRPAPPKAKAAGAKPTAPGTPAKSPATPAVSKKTATPAGPGAVIVTTDDPNELPGMDQPRYPPKADPDDEADKPKAKPIDNALLEKLMKSRNGGGTP